MMPSSRQNRPDAGWNFENSYARLPENFYVRLNPVPVRAPKLVVFNKPLARSLGLNTEALQLNQSGLDSADEPNDQEGGEHPLEDLPPPNDEAPVAAWSAT